MTADRVLALLRELRTLKLMAHTIATFSCRPDTRAAWSLVSLAIEDRIALLRAVLQRDVDVDTLAACEIALAREPLAADDPRDSSTSIEVEAMPAPVTPHRRVTVH